MNEKQIALIELIAKTLDVETDAISPETRLLSTAQEIAISFTIRYQLPLEVVDFDNCTAGDLLDQLA